VLKEVSISPIHPARKRVGFGHAAKKRPCGAFSA
jgi:hypothetical protein